MTVSISVIIPVLDQWRLTEACLRSLAETSPDDVEVIVVDNGSSDETPLHCAQFGSTLFGSRFRYIRLQNNINFGPACNLGAREARGELLFFLNNDTEMNDPWAEKLATDLGRRNLGGTGPLLLYPGGSVQHAGIVFTPMLTTRHLFEHFPASHPLLAARRPLQAITGAALLMRASVFRQLGEFYPEFRNGGEDIDLCARIRALGLGLEICPEVRVTHATSQTAGRFDHDRHNADLLCARQRHAFVPDYHRIMADCGYAVRLTPWLSPYACLEERANALRTRASAGADLHAVLATLTEEPLWQGGYGLAKTKTEDRQLLLRITLNECRFFPSMNAFQELETLAEENRPLKLHARENLAHIRTRLERKQELFAQARLIQSNARRDNDPTLVRAVDDWLRRPPA